MTAETRLGMAWQVLISQVVISKKLVYCDTGIIVAIIMGAADPFFDDAVRFLEVVRSSDMRLVISNLALAEAVDVIRKRIKERRKCTDESGRECEAVEAEVAAAEATLADFIDELKGDKKVVILEEETTVRIDFVHLHKKLRDYKGTTPQARKGNRYRHVGIGPVDWIHIALARLVNAWAICTTDKAFAQIGGDKQYGRMEVIILQPR